MGEYPEFGTPDRWRERDDAAETEQSLQSLQEIAHDRGRICKKRGCVVCAPLRELRREKKKQRKAEAQAAQHAKGKPCGRTSCDLAVCVQAREAAEAPPESPRPENTNSGHGERDQGIRRQADRHRVGLPCGYEDCPRQECVDGFANERIRRHRARRPCRSSTCDNAICVAGRSKR